MEHNMVREFRKELAYIRDKVNFLFDRLESAEKEADNHKIGSQAEKKTEPVRLSAPESGR